MALKNICVLLACLILLCFIISPSVFADDWGEAPTKDDGDHVIEEGEQVWVPLDEPISPEQQAEGIPPNDVEKIAEDIANNDPGWFNRGPGIYNSETDESYYLDESGETEYDIEFTRDWEGNLVGVTVKAKEEEPKEFPEPDDFGPGGEGHRPGRPGVIFAPSNPVPVEWRCYTSDGENKDKRKWQGGWIGSAVDCGTSSAWSSWSAWKCEHTGTAPTNKLIRKPFTANTDAPQETVYPKQKL